jgi:NAD+ kinase
MTSAPVAPPHPVRRIGIVAKHGIHEAAPTLDHLVGWLMGRGVEPIFENDTAKLSSEGRRVRTLSREELPAAVDLVLVLGGDGTLLGMADRIAAADAGTPILGVNFGSLGFLTEVTLPELQESLEAVLAGRAALDERMMLRSRVTRRNQPLADLLVLNEVAVSRGADSRMVDLAVSVDDEFVACFKADGLIVATPTGSTAYNLSAGGPIVHASMAAMILTPIAPHTLTNRPVVIPGSAEVHIQPVLDESGKQAHAMFDGASAIELSVDDVVSIQRASRPLRLVRPGRRSYFGVLRQKLKWAER